MKSRKLVAVGVCGMVAVGLGQGVSAADTPGESKNDVPVSYNYSSAAEPVSPNYAVSIPTGMVFDSKTPDTPLDISVSMTKATGETEIKGDCSATVKVKSAGGYKVSLADGSDAIEYVVKYEGTTLTGPGDANIGTLKKTTAGSDDKLTLVGSAKLQGVATKTGNHIDTLTYTITNVAI